MMAFNNSAGGPMFPSFTAADASADADFDFNILSEYLFEDDKYPLLNPPGDGRVGVQGKPKSGSDISDRDLSDDEDDEEDDDEVGPDGKRRKISKSGKPKDQVDRRRERNRVLARKTRLRKKFFFESLQKQVAQRAAENEMLKNVIEQRVGDDTVKSKILSECNAEIPDVVASATGGATSAMLGKNDFNLISAIQSAQRSFCITDPSLPDNPIIFASKGFLDLSGYQLEEVLGRNCRFLQGPETDAKQVERMRKGISAGEDVSVCLLNYRKDGKRFFNQIFVAALRDANMNVINHVGVQVEIKEKQYADGTTRMALLDAGAPAGSSSSSSSSSSSAARSPAASSGRNKAAGGGGGAGGRARKNSSAGSGSSSSGNLSSSSTSSGGGGGNTGRKMSSTGGVAYARNAAAVPLPAVSRGAAVATVPANLAPGGMNPAAAVYYPTNSTSSMATATATIAALPATDELVGSSNNAYSVPSSGNGSGVAFPASSNGMNDTFGSLGVPNNAAMLSNTETSSAVAGAAVGGASFNPANTTSSSGLFSPTDRP